MTRSEFRIVDLASIIFMALSVAVGARIISGWQNAPVGLYACTPCTNSDHAVGSGDID